MQSINEDLKLLQKIFCFTISQDLWTHKVHTKKKSKNNFE